MKTKTIAAVFPLALLLSACTTVDPAFKDIGTRTGGCVEGGPDTVAQKFYDLRLQQGPAASLPDSNRLAQLQPYLSKVLYQDLVTANQNPGKHQVTGDLFSGNAQGATSATVASSSTIPNTDAKNIPLRVQLSHQKDGGSAVNWQDEVLMVREGTCWVVDDIRYLNVPPHAASGTLRQVLENQ
ncbi:putative lipoprotein [Serratia sp. AS12]|uniref:lipoprotein n=1 Tax=Serratia TaxID=613 RepID=UPI00020E91DC|nr:MULTISPECIES: lipoprotein [Serratia]AEF44765.1 putative lipoprotein [Serratia plymuthica AS9]AEF49717.1 putative lipoprotein [Serratia sp. AS12]AEG27424.1 putative lipoprotein [Serratia sp. AS13]UTN98265.1 lipoprotein [Serratia plymuthica]